MTSSNRKSILVGTALTIFALYLGGLGVFYHRLPSQLYEAPRWIFFLLALLLGFGSGLAYFGQDHPLSNILAAAVWLLFAVVGAWAALISPLEGLSGGLATLSPTANRGLARIVFGLGAILNVGAGIYAGWQYFKK